MSTTKAPNMQEQLRQRKVTETPDAKAAAKQHRRAPPSTGRGQVKLQPRDSAATEAMLREFDLNSEYGPCAGMTRLERWDRAQKWGLSPPQNVRDALLAGAKGEGIWEGRL